METYEEGKKIKFVVIGNAKQHGALVIWYTLPFLSSKIVIDWIVIQIIQHITCALTPFTSSISLT